MVDEKIIRKIGLKYGMSDEEVEELVKLSFLFIKKTIEGIDKTNPKFKNIRMPGLGMFYVSDKYKKYINYKINGKCKDSSGSGEQECSELLCDGVGTECEA